MPGRDLRFSPVGSGTVRLDLTTPSAGPSGVTNRSRIEDGLSGPDGANALEYPARQASGLSVPATYNSDSASAQAEIAPLKIHSGNCRDFGFLSMALQQIFRLPRASVWSLDILSSDDKRAEVMPRGQYGQPLTTEAMVVNGSESEGHQEVVNRLRLIDLLVDLLDKDDDATRLRNPRSEWWGRTPEG